MPRPDIEAGVGAIRPPLLLLCVLSVQVLLAACSGSPPIPTPVVPITTPDVAFATIVPITQINTHVKLEISKENTDKLKIGSDFALWVENQGDEPVSFPYNLGAKIFTYSQADARWIALGNRVKYAVQADGILNGKRHGATSTTLFDVWPDLPASQQPVTVRVVVIGRLGSNVSANTPVAAYVDITLPP
jgi:hypothetical protein